MKQTYFFRPSHPLNKREKLDIDLIRRNIAVGIETTLLIDTNLLIAIEKTVKLGNTSSIMEQAGLKRLVSLALGSPPKSLCLSPGLALAEMPPALASRAQSAYQSFCKVHLPTFADTPNTINSIFEGKVVDYGFNDLEEAKKKLLAIPYYALLILNLADKQSKAKPQVKFERYIEELANNLNVLSAKEIEIAKHCLFEPKASDKTKIDLRKKLRSNFLKTKEDKGISSAKDAFSVAFNGACDLTLINAATRLQRNGLDGVTQDCWVVTADRKLYEFSTVFEYLDVFGQAGQFAVSSISATQADDPCWQAANELHQRLILNRVGRVSPSPEQLLDSVKLAVNETNRFYGVA